MITFTSIEIRNFLSVGDAPITLQLNRSPTTLITGKNGAGKSTILESVCFALFGKSFRGINKPQLINTINQKGALVTLSFSKSEDVYVVNRGIKPNIFTITKNGEELDESAAVKDFQVVLEDILGFTFNDFIKTRLIGHANYKPFLMLTGPERRVLVDSLLNLELYTKMAQVHKGRVSEMNTEQRSLLSELDKSQSLYKSVQNGLDTMSNVQSIEVERKEKKLQELVEEAIELKEKVKGKEEILLEEIKELNSKLSVISDAVRKTSNEQSLLLSEQRKLKQSISFWETTSHCDSCKQSIDEFHSKEQIEELQKQLSEAVSKLENLKDSSDQQEKQSSELSGALTDKNNELHQIRLQTSRIKEISRVVKELHNEITTMEEQNTDSIEPMKQELELHKNEIKRVSQLLEEIESKQFLMKATTEMLKDGGLKASIIKKYVPMLNNMVNQYLTIMGFPLRCEVDETFNETLRGRFKDEFNYQNLSQGERQRLDLAFLFAWQRVASICSGVDCNLLMLDEVGDSSMDSVGIDALFQIIDSLTDSNVFIISHRPDMADRCRSKIELHKNASGFTKVL